MHRRIGLACVLLLLAVASAAAEELSVGDAAPPFVLPGSDHATHSLEKLLETHRGVVLAWFPKAFTPG